ncbi:MAG: hypothetical protein AAGD33_14645 [Actinomycetota bacterium]
MTPAEPSPIIGLEFLVPDLDGAVAVFTDALGWTVVERGPTADVAGHRAVLTAGPGTAPVVTLLAASDSGPGTVVVDRSPRLTQVVLGTPDVDELGARLNLLGLPTEAAPGGAIVDPAAMAGVWGAAAALVTTEVGDRAPDPAAEE